MRDVSPEAIVRDLKHLQRCLGSLADSDCGGAIEAVADDVREHGGGEQAVDHFKVAAARHGLLDLVLLRLAEVLARAAAPPFSHSAVALLRHRLADAPPDLGGGDLAEVRRLKAKAWARGRGPWSGVWGLGSGSGFGVRVRVL